MTYYNGYGWNFYYNLGNYYADTANAPVPDPPFNWGEAVGICFLVICICAVLIWQNKDEIGDDIFTEEHVVTETVVETHIETESSSDYVEAPSGLQRKYTMGS